MSKVVNKQGAILMIAILSIIGFIIIGIPLFVLIALNPPWFDKFFFGLILTAGVPVSIIFAIRFYKIDIKKFCYGDMSFWSLILANLLAIAIAITQSWPLGSVMWVYLCQSFTIGFFWFLKILMLKDFSIEGIWFKSTEDVKLKTAGFFLLHYGFFHFFYLFTLRTKVKYTLDASVIFMALVFFFVIVFHFFTTEVGKLQENRIFKR